MLVFANLASFFLVSFGATLVQETSRKVALDGFVLTLIAKSSLSPNKDVISFRLIDILCNFSVADLYQKRDWQRARGDLSCEMA